jgi:hypothetical protein
MYQHFDGRMADTEGVNVIEWVCGRMKGKGMRG